MLGFGSPVVVPEAMTGVGSALFPKEHGAYGQLSFPLVTAFAAAGVSPGGLLMAIATIAAFLAHEPLLIISGHRGPRARRDAPPFVTRYLAACLIVGMATGFAAVLMMPPAARWSIVVPLLPALILVAAAARGNEKSSLGEAAAAIAFSAVAVPVSMSAGAGPTTAAVIAIPFALLFVTTTLAVRVVILRVRRGGDLRAATATRAGVLSIAAGGLATLAAAVVAGLLPVSVVVSSAPGLAIAAFVALSPPSPVHLRELGWTLVAVSCATAVLVIATA